MLTLRSLIPAAIDSSLSSSAAQSLPTFKTTKSFACIQHKTTSPPSPNWAKEIEQMVGAAIDAPGGSVATTIYNLVKDPRTFNKPRQEHVILNACIDDAMRLHPLVATDLIRRTPPDGMVVDGMPVPGNTDIFISAYTSRRDPAVSPSPEKWYPDQWVENRGTELMKDMLASWIPLSAGYRTCMGRNVSIVIQACVFGTLVHNYDFALPSKDWELPFE